MSFEAKQLLLKEFEYGLKDKLTVIQLTETMELLSSKLSGYEVESIEINEDENESEEFLEAYISSKRVEGKSQKTIERYTYVISRFFKTVSIRPRKITVYHIRKYLMDLKDKGNSDRTLEGYRTVLNTYFAWLNNEGLISSNPCANIGSIKFQKKVKTVLSDVDMMKIWEVCDKNMNWGSRCTGIRDKAIVSFLVSTGCRVSELCAINKENLDIDHLQCKVHGKGNKDRIVYLDSVTALFIKRYLESRDDDFPALFIGKRSERMTPGGIRAMLKRVQVASGVENIHPHRFRRTLATNLISRGMPIQEVSMILGHEKIDTTMNYVCIDRSNLSTSYRKFS